MAHCWAVPTHDSPGSIPVLGSSISTAGQPPTSDTATLSFRLLPPLYVPHTLRSSSGNQQAVMGWEERCVTGIASVGFWRFYRRLTNRV